MDSHRYALAFIINYLIVYLNSSSKFSRYHIRNYCFFRSLGSSLMHHHHMLSLYFLNCCCSHNRALCSMCYCCNHYYVLCFLNYCRNHNYALCFLSYYRNRILCFLSYCCNHNRNLCFLHNCYHTCCSCSNCSFHNHICLRTIIKIR